MTTELENPESASTGVRIPVSTKASKARIATRSARILFVMNKTTVIPKMMNVSVSCTGTSILSSYHYNHCSIERKKAPTGNVHLREHFYSVNFLSPRGHFFYR